MASAWGKSWGLAWGDAWGKIGTVTPPVVTPPSVGATLGGYWPKMKTFADQRREQEEAQLIARNNAAIVALLF